MKIIQLHDYETLCKLHNVESKITKKIYKSWSNEHIILCETYAKKLVLYNRCNMPGGIIYNKDIKAWYDKIEDTPLKKVYYKDMKDLFNILSDYIYSIDKHFSGYEIEIDTHAGKLKINILYIVSYKLFINTETNAFHLYSECNNNLYYYFTLKNNCVIDIEKLNYNKVKNIYKEVI